MLDRLLRFSGCTVSGFVSGLEGTSRKVAISEVEWLTQLLLRGEW